MHYKFLKKIIEALGYKIIDKNLIKNERLLSKYSFLSLEKILENLFTKGEIQSIIQIGANDGKRFDIINKFIKKFETFAIFVEPIKSNFDNLKKNYSDQNNLFYENLAISVNDEISELYKVKKEKIELYDDHIVGITSFNKKHLLNHGVRKKDIVKEKVNTISIKDLISKHSIKNLDLLLIDTEGYDAKIVEDFLINSTLRPYIIFEYIHSNHKNFLDTIKLLINKDYLLFDISENVICFPKNKKGNIRFV